MTSDDTKVDTSDWVGITTHPHPIITEYIIHDKGTGAVKARCFDQNIRDQFLLAIRDLPKVTAERDDLIHDVNELLRIASEEAAERDALSARVKELSSALSDLINHCQHTPQDDRTFEESVERAANTLNIEVPDGQ